PNSQDTHREHQRYSQLLRKADVDWDYKEKLLREFDDWKISRVPQFWADRSIQNSAIRTLAKLVTGSELFARQSLD
ncbi:hypothetical protein BGZ76_005398, partial [Entomortierella beljakovae]